MSRRFPRAAPALILAAVVAWSGCSEDRLPTAPGPDVRTARQGPPEAVVQPGQSIQAAIDAAAPGDRIFLAPGTYAQAVTIDKPGIRLMGLGTHPDSRGRGRVVLQNPGGANHGIHVTADGVEIRNLTVRGYDRNGIFLLDVDGFHLADIVAEANGSYGLYPRRSKNGVIERSVASGHADAGFYVGLSQNVALRDNVAFGNVNGFEITNSTDVEARRNRVYGNTAAFLVALLPFRSVKENRDIRITENRIQANNLENFADEGLARHVPAGSGILVLGGTDITVRDNEVTGHDFVGIALGSVAVLALLEGIDPSALDVDPDPDGVRIVDNVATGNGGATWLGLPGVDLLWVPSGGDNCWEGNVYATSFPEVLPGCS